LPFNPPEQVRKWLRQEDWQALSKAWEEAEAQAISWAEGEGEEDDDAWEEQQESVAWSSSLLPTSSITSSSLQRSRRRKPWDKEFYLVGNDHRYPVPLRRYFDPVPSENSLPKQATRPGLKPPPVDPRAPDLKMPPAFKARHEWDHTHTSMASTDNVRLHPLNRHYFDRRGAEASYRARPHVDHATLRAQKPRTPGRPSTRERMMRYCASEPSMSTQTVEEEPEVDAKARGYGNLNWGNRCLLHGQDFKAKIRANSGDRIPWVHDHQVSVNLDNEGLHPTLRHYFDGDGIETSFRTRGHHFGRKLPTLQFAESFGNIGPHDPDTGMSSVSSVSPSKRGKTGGRGRGRQEPPPPRAGKP
jgi:hypothetical protein